MNIAQIENNLKSFLDKFDEPSFIYEFLLAYGQPKASIKRLKEGGLNLSKRNGEILWKKKLYFKETKDSDLHELIDELKIDDSIMKHSPRFIIVTDYKQLLARDTKTNETLDIEILDLPRYFDFFLPLAGMEKAQHQFENPADVKAAERMGKLYDEIKKDNPTDTGEEVHNLNVFLTRLLFCFFAEDTNIFEKSQFTHSLINHTQEDGSDLHTHFERLFQVMNTPDTLRGEMPEFLNEFPYVNGGLFRNNHSVPQFSRKSRQVIIESGELDWSAINPDIFGSMIQAVVTPEHRGGLGMHYTSVPNIMKVIEPLFLNEFYEEFESSIGNSKKLRLLLNRIWDTKYFDPACGSGNFLIITYKELRKLEMKIFKSLNEMALSNISLSQFYGIELDDFAHEVAILSLWLAEHQMNEIFFKEFGRSKPALPLTTAGNIIHGNACRLDWEKVCPIDIGDEVYFMGNPPYLGSSMQSNEQKRDMSLVFSDLENYKNLDYISIWFYKGAKFIRHSNSRLAFVSTNSITQGEQVSLLWPPIFNFNLEIGFAYSSFKWANNAKSNAGVSVVIIGLRNNSEKRPKCLFLDDRKKNVNNINAYLTDAKNIFIEKRKTPISKFPEMVLGNAPKDGGHLLLNIEEKSRIIELGIPEIKVKNFMGAFELMNSDSKFCLWFSHDDFMKYNNIPELSTRFNKVVEMRLSSPKIATQEFANKPYRFIEIRHKETPVAIIIPSVGSSKRQYIPIGFVNNDTVVSNSAQVIYGENNTYIFSILSSRMHIIWVKATAGYLKMDFRYSSVLCYNTFPFPYITENQKTELEKYVYKILEVRENYSEKTLSQLYDPDKMPESLQEAHHQLDLAVERCYRSKPFESDEERLEYLFKLYEQMIAEEKSRGTLFEMESKPKKKKK